MRYLHKVKAKWAETDEASIRIILYKGLITDLDKTWHWMFYTKKLEEY
jgi:hypothetical protein